MKQKLWFSFFNRKEYVGDAPAFYDNDAFSWSKTLEENYDDIYNELTTYLNTEKDLKAYFNQLMVDKKDAWKTIPLMAWGVSFYKNKKKFPKTMEILNQIPGLVSISFNLLEPNSKIVPHYGDTNAIMRCHYGLEIPATLPQVGFQVKDEIRSWEKAKLLIFCDGYIHSAWNNSDMPRYILLFDVVLPEFSYKKNVVCATVLSSLFLQSRASKLRIKKEPHFLIVYPLFHLAKLGAFFSKPIYNLMGKIRYGYK